MKSEIGRGVGRYFRISMREVADHVFRGHADAADYLRGPHGGVRAGALLTMLDSVGGLCAGISSLPDGWVVSTNLAARAVRTQHVGPFRVDANVLRRGRNNVVSSVQISDAGNDGALVMDGILTSAVLVPENGPPEWTRPLEIDAGDPLPDTPKIEEWLGVREVADDVLEMELSDAHRNPWGILHGGVVASLVDLATGGVTTDVVLHFLAPNRVGPIRATTRRLGTRSDGDVSRIEIRDVGADRVTALAVATAVR
jgi:acyl-coenzyme A thioesterase PaaI-like protein